MEQLTVKEQVEVDGVLRFAEKSIFAKTGMRMRLLVVQESAEEQSERVDDRPEPEEVVLLIANRLNIAISDLRSGSRTRELVAARHVACKILRDRYLGITLERIAGLIGGKNHTTVLHGVRGAEMRLLMEDSFFVERYNKALATVDKIFGKQYDK